MAFVERIETTSWSSTHTSSKGLLAIIYRKPFSFHRLTLACLIIENISCYCRGWDMKLANPLSSCCHYALWPSKGWSHLKVRTQRTLSTPHLLRFPVATAPLYQEPKGTSVSLANLPQVMHSTRSSSWAQLQETPDSSQDSAMRFHGRCSQALGLGSGPHPSQEAGLPALGLRGQAQTPSQPRLLLLWAPGFGRSPGA